MSWLVGEVVRFMNELVDKVVDMIYYLCMIDMI